MNIGTPIKVLVATINGGPSQAPAVVMQDAGDRVRVWLPGIKQDRWISRESIVNDATPTVVVTMED